MKKKVILIFLAIVIALSSMYLGACVEKKYNIRYNTDGNGTIQGKSEQNLTSGSETLSVTAVPNEGYKFVKWSDNNTEVERTDKVENDDLIFTAIFEKCKYTVSYLATAGCYINGEMNQTVEYGESTSEVTAELYYGYRFVKWSDNGSTNPVRTDINVRSDITATAIVELIRADVQILQYQTDGNGTIEGKEYQDVVYDRNASVVTAIPNDGYEFLQWSDGVTTAERQDMNVTESKTLTAQFKRIYVRYTLDYKFGNSIRKVTELIFYENNFKIVDFPVPIRDLFTFEGWYIGETQVTNANGKMMIGKELLEKEGKEIYAKWKAKENYTYKVLMVYVTELDATIPKIDGSGEVDVHYRMSEFDIEICKTITMQMRTYLNNLMDGLVTFEVDEYFTKSVVGTNSLTIGRKATWLEDIPEIVDSGLNKLYNSVINTFCMNDYEHQFRNCAGVATTKYATVYLESVYDENMINNDPLDDILDVNYWRWHSIIEPFIHELAHTIELQIRGSYSYHSVLTWFHKQEIYDHLLINKLYYLNLVEIDGQYVGIPLAFWKGELDLIPGD